MSTVSLTLDAIYALAHDTMTAIGCDATNAAALADAGAPDSWRRFLQWHEANLEYANAAALKQRSLLHWDQDDPYDFTGTHSLLPGGNTRIVRELAKDVPIVYGCQAKAVRYSVADGVEVENAP